jgi:fused signal recognition particle receptor
MIGLWIALGVVVVLLLGTLVVRSRRRGAPSRDLPTEAAKPAVRPPPAAVRERAPIAEPPSAEPPSAEPPGTAPPISTPDVAPVVAPSFRDRLGKARGLFSGVLSSVRSQGVQPATWDDLEEALLRADVGVATTQSVLEELRGKVKRKEVTGGDQLVAALRAELLGVLASDASPGGRALSFVQEDGFVNVWLFVGVNGVGKTTTVGKVALAQSQLGRSVLLAAGDTFRAAAGEQLELWAERTGVDIVRGAEGGDPSAVVFDAVQRASARHHDLVLADTAGRLHTKVNLVEELKKIRRVADRAPGRVSEVLLVLDATIGQNALAQAREFTDAVDVTGLVLTKLDGTAKGGMVIAVERELGIPVKLVGLGEGPGDLIAFDPSAFVDALLG